MSDIRRLPVLSLTDVVVLPGMVVPIELDEPAQAAVDAAKSAHSGEPEPDRDGIGELLLAPRLEDRYSTFGVVATIEQVGRLAGGAPAAVLRAGRRARIGTGVSGPGAALWVQAELVDAPLVTDHTKFSRNPMVRLGHISEIDALFTDDQPPDEIAAALAQAKVRLYVTGSEGKRVPPPVPA